MGCSVAAPASPTPQKSQGKGFYRRREAGHLLEGLISEVQLPLCPLSIAAGSGAVVRQPQVLARAAEHVLKFIRNAGQDLVAAEIADRSAAAIGSPGVSSL